MQQQRRPQDQHGRRLHSGGVRGGSRSSLVPQRSLTDARRSVRPYRPSGPPPPAARVRPYCLRLTGTGRRAWPRPRRSSRAEPPLDVCHDVRHRRRRPPPLALSARRQTLPSRSQRRHRRFRPRLRLRLRLLRLRLRLRRLRLRRPPPRLLRLWLRLRLRLRWLPPRRLRLRVCRDLSLPAPSAPLSLSLSLASPLPSRPCTRQTNAHTHPCTTRGQLGGGG